MTKEQIMNEYAVSEGYEHWDELQLATSGNELKDHINAVIDLTQKELLNRVIYYAEVENIVELNGDSYYVINEKSILNTPIL